MEEENKLDSQNYSEHTEMLSRETAYKIRVGNLLNRLMEESKDPAYNQYLAQMIRDLDSGRATPWQVEQEAQRSYQQYKQRMIQQEMAQVHAIHRQQAAEGMKPKSTMEFKVGVHIFGFLGAIFILSSFVIFGFHFLNGLAQGLCLYGIAVIFVLLSELLLSRRFPKFSRVLTGIGIGGLYVANIVNFLVLHTINGIVALIVTLFIAASTFFISRKKESAAMRIISLIGCYICFLPVKGFETEFEFLISTLLLFIINAFSVFIRNQKHQIAIDSVHIFLNLLFTTILTGYVWTEELSSAYLVLFVLTAFVFCNLLALKRSTEKENIVFVFCCIANGIYLFLLFLIGTVSPEMTDARMALFVHLLTEVLVAAVCGIFFLLWKKEDGKKWAQVYYVAGTGFFLSAYANYPLERIITSLAVFLLIKVFADQKEMRALDCIAAAWIGIQGLWWSDEWYCWLFAAALLLSILKVRGTYIYHELVITLSILAIWWGQCEFYLSNNFDFDKGWLYPVSAGGLLLLFLLFNHLPWLKDKNQKPYNIICVISMIMYYLGVWLCDSYIFSSIMMVLGTISIIVIFRERYKMKLPRKQLFLAGFLVCYSLTGHYESPVIVSILLMIVALLCVGGGFKLHDKAERICGLVLALFVCIKLVVYDFREVDIFYKMIVFLVVGAIALLISFIYIQLEKTMERQEE